MTIPDNLNFKKGEVLRCIIPNSSLVEGKHYVALEDAEAGNSHTPEPFIRVGKIGSLASYYYTYAWRFEKV